MKNTPSLRGLSDHALTAEAKRLVSAERRATAALLRVLGEIDARRLYLGEGCPSLFVYCTQVLHLAEGAAYNRIEAARAARRFPAVLDALDAGDLTLTSIRLLKPHLTDANLEETLRAARHLGKRDLEVLIASLRPRPDVAPSIRKLPSRTAVGQAQDVAKPAVQAAASLIPTGQHEPAAPPTPRSTWVSHPLTPERYKIQFTVSRETHDKLRRVQDLLRHAVPSGDPAEIFDRSLTLLLDDLERRRLAKTGRPRPAEPPVAAHSRHIPAHVQREVWKRDEARCAFVGAEGRCRETGFLELHHVRPFAAGGTATVQNIELRCRAHNAYEADLFFGSALIRETRSEWGHSVARLALVDLRC